MSPSRLEVAIAIFAQVGDTLNYVITVMNASGPATAAVLVHDMPGVPRRRLVTCTPTGTGATCAGGAPATCSATRPSLPSGNAGVLLLGHRGGRAGHDREPRQRGMYRT